MNDENLNKDDFCRDVYINRHMDVMLQMEESITDMFLEDNVEHPRLASMIKDLDAPSEQERIDDTIDAVAADKYLLNLKLKEAVLQYLCLVRERGGIEIATLQLHIIGVYRRVLHAIIRQTGIRFKVDELREMPASKMPSMVRQDPVPFGSYDMTGKIPMSKGLVDEVFAFIKNARQVSKKTWWEDSTRAHGLPRELETSIMDLPENERDKKREELISSRVRTRFYKEIFLTYFNIDEFDPESTKSLVTVFDWIKNIQETPHLYPFMQGQGNEQKSFRLKMLIEKLVQINEIYQRVENAKRDDSFEVDLDGKTTKEVLVILTKHKYPISKATPDFICATMLCRLPTFATWISERVKDKDFVLPPSKNKV